MSIFFVSKFSKQNRCFISKIEVFFHFFVVFFCQILPTLLNAEDFGRLESYFSLFNDGNIDQIKLRCSTKMLELAQRNDELKAVQLRKFCNKFAIEVKFFFKLNNKEIKQKITFFFYLCCFFHQKG